MRTAGPAETSWGLICPQGLWDSTLRSADPGNSSRMSSTWQGQKGAQDEGPGGRKGPKGDPGLTADHQRCRRKRGEWPGLALHSRGLCSSGTRKTERALGILGCTGLWENASVGLWVQGELAL